ncbi:MAG: hypothetical protein NTX45_00265 [Proteobacteria bacterium]|nr:hypothetical protein [Pseudomonadota bacterium]
MGEHYPQTEQSEDKYEMNEMNHEHLILARGLGSILDDHDGNSNGVTATSEPCIWTLEASEPSPLNLQWGSSTLVRPHNGQIGIYQGLPFPPTSGGYNPGIWDDQPNPWNTGFNLAGYNCCYAYQTYGGDWRYLIKLKTDFKSVTVQSKPCYWTLMAYEIQGDLVLQWGSNFEKPNSGITGVRPHNGVIGVYQKPFPENPTEGFFKYVSDQSPNPWNTGLRYGKNWYCCYAYETYGSAKKYLVKLTTT